jgi:hypothetical protein
VQRETETERSLKNKARNANTQLYGAYTRFANDIDAEQLIAADPGTKITNERQSFEILVAAEPKIGGISTKC